MNARSQSLAVGVIAKAAWSPSAASAATGPRARTDGLGAAPATAVDTHAKKTARNNTPRVTSFQSREAQAAPMLPPR